MRFFYGSLDGFNPQILPKTLIFSHDGQKFRPRQENGSK